MVLALKRKKERKFRVSCSPTGVEEEEEGGEVVEHKTGQSKI